MVIIALKSSNYGNFDRQYKLGFQHSAAMSTSQTTRNSLPTKITGIYSAEVGFLVTAVYERPSDIYACGPYHYKITSEGCSRSIASLVPFMIAKWTTRVVQYWHDHFISKKAQYIKGSHYHKEPSH